MAEESIKHLVFREEPAEVRRVPMYRSKYSKQVRAEAARAKECHRTMGLPPEMLQPTRIRPGHRKVIRPDVEKWRPNKPRLSPVPRRDEWPGRLHKEQPNYPLRNALEATRSAPPQGPSRAVVSGHRIHDCNRLLPVFVFKEGFGKVPKYLEEARRAAEEERRRREAERQEAEAQAEVVKGLDLISPEERDQLIQGLKAAWEEQTRQYKLLPLVVDSTPMIKKKRNLEASLERIEKNIDLLERNKFIFVKQ